LAQNEVVCPNCGIRMDILIGIGYAAVAEAGGEDQVTA
jgi:hypothetical protein